MIYDSSPQRGFQPEWQERHGAGESGASQTAAARGASAKALAVARPQARSGMLLEPATQIVTDRGAYLGQGRFDIGQRLADDQVELFISGDPGIALQRQFEQHECQFIAVHDVCTSASLRLLKSLADGAGLPLQRLTVRRQGDGSALVQLQFVELALADGSRLRLYSTDTSAEPPQQRSVARALLGFATLSVLIVADGAPALLTNCLRPLREAIARGPWPNRDMLVIPLGDNAALAPLVTELPGPSALAVHITPQARQTAHMWVYINNTWNRVGPQALAAGSGQPLPSARPPVLSKPVQPSPPANGPARQSAAPSRAPARAPLANAPRRGSDNTTIPGPLEVAQARAVAPSAAAHAYSPHNAQRGTHHAPHQPAVVVPIAPRPSAARSGSAPSAPRAMPSPGATLWADYMRRCGRIKGAVAGCVFDSHNGTVMAATGGPTPSPERLALQGMALLTQAVSATRSLGAGAAPPEIAISTPLHHLLVRPVPGHPGVALHLVLSAETGSLTLARMHLERIESPT
jgi:hypothetical protein